MSSALCPPKVSQVPQHICASAHSHTFQYVFHTVADTLPMISFTGLKFLNTSVRQCTATPFKIVFYTMADTLPMISFNCSSQAVITALVRLSFEQRYTLKDGGGGGGGSKF